MEVYRLLAIATQVDLRSKPFTGLPPLFLWLNVLFKAQDATLYPFDWL